MKTVKAYGLWSPVVADVISWSIRPNPFACRNIAWKDFSYPDWEAASSSGYRVIPVTITYEEPEVKK